MNKTAIKNFAIWARVNLIEAVKQRAYQYEITKDNITDAGADVVSGKPLSKEEKEQRRQLIDQINRKGFDQVMEEVAYTWFNRFIALRFMEVNGYLPSKIRVFTDSEGNFKPEILKEALTAEIHVDKARVMELLEKQDNEELYKYLLIAQCNELSTGLPDMFEVISNYTELLFPNNLLKEDSILGQLVNTIPEEDWTDAVQIIGWMYQFYNTELNELVYDGSLAKNRLNKELIPAATTIYTPDWSVRYMVENSLGRLWYEGHPNEEIKKEWKYYLDEAQQEPEVEEQLKAIREEYKSIKPEDIKVIDPCMGSGHILVYAFDVLLQIYISAGWSERDAAESILENNLYGLDIDDRAGQLAYFAVMMKARKYNRHILTKNIRPKVYSIQESNNITVNAWWRFGSEEDIARRLVQDFTDAKEYGSILNLSVTIEELQALRKRLDDIEEMSDMGNLLDMMQSDEITRQFYPLVELAEVMVQKYDVVVTNPPYLGNGRFSVKLDSYVKANYPEEKSDLSMVMLNKALEGFAVENGFVAFITTSSWMFLSGFEKVRLKLYRNNCISSLVDYGTELFEGKVGHNPIVSWVTRISKISSSFIAVRLVDYCYAQRDRKKTEFFDSKNRYVAKQEEFVLIPTAPVAYWASDLFLDTFRKGRPVSEISKGKSGQNTGDNNRFLRRWYEVGVHKIGFGLQSNYSGYGHKWIPYNKGGEYRRWYGNYTYIVNWEEDGKEIKEYAVFRNNGKHWSRYIQNLDTLYHSGITWSMITSGNFSMRYLPEGFICDYSGCSIFPDEIINYYMLALFNTVIATEVLKMINPTINCQPGNVGCVPYIYESKAKDKTDEIVSNCIECSKADWDSYETSWDYKVNPLI